MIKLKGVKDWLHVLYICLPSRYPDVMVPEWTLLQVHMSDWKWKQCELLPFVTDGRDSLQAPSASSDASLRADSVTEWRMTSLILTS